MPSSDTDTVIIVGRTFDEVGRKTLIHDKIRGKLNYTLQRLGLVWGISVPHNFSYWQQTEGKQQTTEAEDKVKVQSCGAVIFELFDTCYRKSDHKMTSVEELKAKIEKLEQELAVEKSKNSQNAPARGKIAQMSSEVVDSNPYRLAVIDKLRLLIQRRYHSLNFVPFGIVLVAEIQKNKNIVFKP